ncbi:uncharacterized protein Hcs isoform X3 [Panulirus ornatus]|uniref:uncharacterized protein Hcs isoform X3 n=1 Tax=Panulirus ornatus TaxID=150431 RepID=UPI003A863F6A
MLSMCGLLCRMLRGWRHSEAVMLMAKALSQPHSSLLVQDIMTSSTAGGVTVNEPCGTSLFCQNSSEGTLGQLLWRDNNKQAVIISPKQCVDLQRWTLFLSSSDNPSTSTFRKAPQPASENGTATSKKSEISGTVTVLLEATYRERDDEPAVDCHVMVEHLSQPYAWKARDVFGVIVITTPPQLLAMIQAFFNNALLIDDDFLIKKILTIEVVGKPSTMEDPLSIPESVSPGPWNMDRIPLTQMELARSLSPTSYPGQPTTTGCGDIGLCSNSLRPPLLSALLRHQSSGESATDTSTTINPQSSSDSDKHASSLDPQSSYDSISDYPTSDADDVPCNVYNFYPRGWAISGNQVVSGQPLSVRGVLTQMEENQQKKQCSIVTNPMEDLWQESEDAHKVVNGSCANEQSILCLNGPSQNHETRSTLPRVKKDRMGCKYPYTCLSGSVLCKRIEQAQPGKKEREIVKEAAEYYQRALNSAQERKEWIKKSLSSVSDEDNPSCDYSFSGTHDEVVITHEPKKYPVRIRSEADLSRATSIIKDNLANIVQNYLVKSGKSPECHYLSPKIPSESPTLLHPLTSGISDNSLQLSDHPPGMQEPASILEGRDDEDVHITVLMTEVSKATSTMNNEQDLITPAMKIAQQVDEHKFSNVRKEETLVTLEDNDEETMPYFKSNEDLTPNDIVKPVIIPTVNNQCFTKRSEHIPDIPRSKEKKMKTICAANCKVPVRSSGKSERKLIKSDEIIPPAIKRESCIDIPVSNEDEVKSLTAFDNEFAKGRAIVTIHNVHSDSNEARVKAAITERIQVGDVILEKTEGVPTETKVYEPVMKAKKISKITDKKSEKTHGEVIITTPVTKSKKHTDVMQKSKNIHMETDSNAPVATSKKHADTAVTKSEEILEMLWEKQKDRVKPVTIEEMSAGTTKDRPVIGEVQFSPVSVRGKESDLENIVVRSTDNVDRTAYRDDDKHSDVAVHESDKSHTSSLNVLECNSVTTVSQDSCVVSVQNSDFCHESSFNKNESFTDIPIILHEIHQNNQLDNGKIGDTMHSSNHPTTDIVIHEGIDEVNGKESSDTNGDTLSQRPKCLKDIHKLNTKSSTASESSFESLPYRMLTSQPESLTDDIAIELTRAPPDSEKLKAAKIELIRQERINAISLHSLALLELGDSINTSISPGEEGQADEFVNISKEQDASADSLGSASYVCNENREEEINGSSMFDSGVEVMMHEQDNTVTPSLTKPFPSPVESVAESGFSSLKEPVAHEGTTEDGGFDNQSGVSLSKSKDSLDLTDTDRFLVTDTLSDDMETLSLSAGDVTLVESGPVSKEGSARGSISDSSYQDNGLLKFYNTEPPDLDLDSVGIPSPFLDNSPHYAVRDIHDKQLPSVESNHIHYSSDLSPPKYPLQHFAEDSVSRRVAGSCSEASDLEVSKSKFAMRLDEKAVKCFSDDGNESKMKTSESLSSEDTVISRRSFDDYSAKFLSQGSQEEPSEFSGPSVRTSDDEKAEKPIIDMSGSTLQSSDYGKGAVHSVAEARINDKEVIHEELSPHDTNLIISEGQQTIPLSVKSQNDSREEKCIKQVDRKMTVALDQDTKPSENLVTRYSEPYDSMHEINENTAEMKSSEIVAAHEELGCIFSNTSEVTLADSVQSNAGLHLSIADKLKLLNESELLADASVKAESCGKHNTEILNHTLVKDFAQYENVYGVEKSKSSGESPSLPCISNSKKEEKVSSNTDVIVSVTSGTSKSEVSDKSSGNTHETCSTGTSDRPSRHSSRSGVSDLEDEVFLPPTENYIFDGRPVIYCPKIDMENQIGISPPKMAMSVFAVVPAKHSTMNKEIEWMATNKELLQFNQCSSQKLTSKVNTEEFDKTGKSVMQLSGTVSLPESGTIHWNHSAAPIDVITHLSNEVPDMCNLSGNVLMSADTGINELSKHSLLLKSNGEVDMAKEDSNVTIFPQQYAMIKDAEAMVSLKTGKESQGVVDELVKVDKNLDEEGPENLIQSEVKREGWVASRPISAHFTELEPKRKKKYQHSILEKMEDKCVSGRIMESKTPDMLHIERTVDDLQFTSPESHEKHLPDDEIRLQKEESFSKENHVNIHPQTETVLNLSTKAMIKAKGCHLQEEKNIYAEQDVSYSSKPTPKETGEQSKPRLLRMANLERTDTTASPTHQASVKVLDNSDSTPQESPVISSALMSAIRKFPVPVSSLPVDTCTSSNSISIEGTDEESSVIENTSIPATDKKILDSKVKKHTHQNVYRTEKFESEEAASPTPLKCQGGSLEETSSNEFSPIKISDPELKKYGSEELSSLTLDSHGSSTSKSYLEPDLGSVGSSCRIGGSLECLKRDTDKKKSHTHKLGSRTSAKSEDLNMKCDKVSLKSQGSLDKFPHFDQVTAQQKARGARKKILSVDIENKDKTDPNKEMHRSVTLPAGSMASSKKDEKKKEKEEKSKKKKKDKDLVGTSEKKFAMLSLKGLLKRNKSKEKEKDKDKDSSQEKLSSPSLFRKFERKNKSNTQSPLLDEKKNGEQGNVVNGSCNDLENARHSPVATNGKTRPVISGPVSMNQVGNVAGMGVTTTICRGSAGYAASGSDSESPVGSRQSSPKRIVSHPRMASLGTQPSPRLYKHVLTRHLSSSQESVDNPLLSSTHSSPQTSPHTSPKRMVIPASASSLSLPASRDMSPPTPVMGTRALRGSNSSFSVTIGFKPKVEKRSRTMSEGADLNRVSLSPVSKRKEGSRILTQLNKRSSSMEILVCGKIREHCSESRRSPGRSPFSREGSFRLHREISVETLFELPETSPRSSRTQEEYQEYLNELHARNDSQSGSSWSLVEESDMDKAYPETLSRRSSHHTPTGKKLSLPHNMHLSGLRETASSNPNLQRTGSPFVRGVPHSSSFTSSPFRRPHSSAAVFSPAKRVMSTSTGGSPSSDATPGTPLMRVEEEGPCRKNIDNFTEKPPNVLVYAANKTEYFTAVKDTLLHCLNQDRYTVYQLTDEMAFKSPWSGSTTLLVVCGDVPAHVSTVFIRYLLQGGRVFSVCSDFLNMAVPLFGTVEVQEQAVVSISYRQWSSVQLLHHQHCFHSSPQHKRFSRDLENSKGKGTRSAVSVEPTHVEIIDEHGSQHRLNLKILATDDTWGAPSLLSAKVDGGKGIAVFSQVHLERDPRECFATSESTSKLAISNEARLEILRDLLSSELILDTTTLTSVSAYSPAYFLGRHELKQTLLSKLKPHMEGQELKRPHITLQFVTSEMTGRQPDEDVLPILMNACPLTFSTVKYFETLKTTAIGRLVIYCDVMASSMKVTTGLPSLVHGIVVLPTQQTQGKGRTKNTWLSPLGCAMFTTQLHIALSSNLGQHLPFLQHLIAIAVVQAVRELPGYADIPIHLKWPNDIYVGTNIKIGGVIVEASTIGSEIIANVGCGVNLSNSNPTYCINDAVRQHNKEHNTSLCELDRESFLARIFNAFEDLIEVFQTKGPGAVQHHYYKYWLHR